MEIRLALPALPRMELTAADAARALCDRLGMSSDCADEVRLAIIEACLNAFEHGRGQKVQVVLRGDEAVNRRLEIEISDHGPGFDPEMVPLPSIDEKLSGGRKRGWGLELIRQLMDEVDIISRPGGTRLLMTKYVEIER